ncbi:MAG: DUF2058 family protein [Gammaproteobacteria bacterium]|nr:DUF2058 family protein [Gammaproteobacteria bacterium]
MSNPFQDQLLKAGVVTKKQVQKARQEKTRQQKKQRHNNETVVDETRVKTQAAAQEKAKRDRELNQQKQLQAKQKATSIEINQLIENNCIARDESCEIVYNFEHNKKVRRIYLNPEMKQKVILGKLGIARIEGRYEVVPQAIAEKIKQRNEKRIIIFDDTEETSNADDAYADYQIPDDLTW